MSGREKSKIPQLLTCGVFIAFVICLGFFFYMVYWRNPPQPLPIYSASVVDKVCQTFAIDPQDIFCTNPNEQNAISMEAMLERNYPLKTTTYDEIMSHFTVMLGRPSDHQFKGFEGGVCPPISERGDVFQCMILFTDEIVWMVIYFETSTGKVMQYGVWRPSDS